MISPCSGMRSRVTNWQCSPPWTACGIHKRTRFPLKTSFERYVTRPGRRGFSATPLWMRTPEKSSNPLWNGRKRLRNMQNSSLGRTRTRGFQPARSVRSGKHYHRRPSVATHLQRGIHDQKVGLIAVNASTEYFDHNGGEAATCYPIHPLMAYRQREVVGARS